MERQLGPLHERRFTLHETKGLETMLYLCLAFSFAWVCHLTYLLVVDSHVRQLRRRLDARARAATNEA